MKSVARVSQTSSLWMTPRRLDTTEYRFRDPSQGVDKKCGWSLIRAIADEALTRPVSCALPRDSGPDL